MTLEKKIDRVLKTWMFAGIAATLWCYTPKNNANTTREDRERVEYNIENSNETQIVIPECYELFGNSNSKIVSLLDIIKKNKLMKEEKIKHIAGLSKQSIGPTKYAGQLENSNKARVIQRKGNCIESVEGIATYYTTSEGEYTTSTGAIFRDDLPTIAVNERLGYRIPALVRVTNLNNGKSIEAVANDHGPYKANSDGSAVIISGKPIPHRDRVIDASEYTAEKLGFKENGITRVRVEYLETIDLKK